MNRTIKGLAMALLLAAVAMPAAAQQKQAIPAGKKKFQCWTDENGNRACGDRVPPEFVQQERTVIDSMGRTVDTRDRQKTPEELAAEQKAAAEAAALKLENQKKADYDRFLTDSYSSVKDLERARNERLATLDGRANLTRQSIEADEKTKTGLDALITTRLKNGRKVEEQQRQLREIQKSLRGNKAAVEQLAKDREKICVDFNRDILRYQELTMGSSAYAGSCPEVGSPILAKVLEAPKLTAEELKKKEEKKKARLAAEAAKKPKKKPPPKPKGGVE